MIKYSKLLHITLAAYSLSTFVTTLGVHAETPASSISEKLAHKNISGAVLTLTRTAWTQKEIDDDIAKRAGRVIVRDGKSAKMTVIRPLQVWTYTVSVHLPGRKNSVDCWRKVVKKIDYPWSVDRTFKVHDLAFNSGAGAVMVLYEEVGEMRCDILTTPQDGFVRPDRDKSLLPLPKMQLKAGMEEPVLRAKSAKIVFRKGVPYVNVVASDDKRSSYVWQQDKAIWKRVIFPKRQPAKISKPVDKKPIDDTKVATQ